MLDLIGIFPKTPYFISSQTEDSVIFFFPEREKKGTKSFFSG